MNARFGEYLIENPQEAKAVVDDAPGNVLEAVDKEAAEALAAICGETDLLGAQPRTAVENGVAGGDGVGDKCDLVTQSHTHDCARRAQHLLHPRAAGGTLVTDDDHVSRLHLAGQDALAGVLETKFQILDVRLRQAQASTTIQSLIEPLRTPTARCCAK